MRSERLNSPPTPRTYYSQGFKQQVVSEIESGKFTKDGARRHYQIKGKSTVLNWIRKFGNLHQIKAENRIVMQNEKDEITLLRSENAQLKIANQLLINQVSESQIKAQIFERMIEITEQDLGIDIKKKPM